MLCTIQLGQWSSTLVTTTYFEGKISVSPTKLGNKIKNVKSKKKLTEITYEQTQAFLFFFKMEITFLTSEF